MDNPSKAQFKHKSFLEIKTDRRYPKLLFQWSTPSEVLQSYQARELWIAPPQFYELSRMCRFPLLNDLHNFSSRRATEGCEHWVPVVINDPHYISLLPGADHLSRLFHIQTCSEAEQIVHLVKYIVSETRLKEHLLPWPSCYPCYSFSCVWGEVSKWNSYMRAYDKLTMSVCFFLLLSFPGDKLYPLDTSGEAETDKSTDPPQEHHQHSGLHRMVIQDPYSLSLQVTITPKYNHVLPVVGQALESKADSNSQLWLAP